jgi:hypothetical protein
MAGNIPMSIMIRFATANEPPLLDEDEARRLEAAAEVLQWRMALGIGGPAEQRRLRSAIAALHDVLHASS